MTKFVAYLRVSTQRQGASGLGLEAQRAAVAAFVAQRGGQVLAEHLEVESGRKCDRPQMAAALAEAKRQGAVLLIAKLDRLARSVHFISGLLAAGVEVLACDMPEANRFMLHVMAAIAEHEAEAISARTKAALAAAKARGTKLGWAQPQRDKAAHAAAVAKGGASTAAAADTFAAKVLPIVQPLRDQGHSLRQIGAELERLGITTPRGGRTWQAVQVRALLQRAA